MLRMFCSKSEMTQSWLFSVSKISDIALEMYQTSGRLTHGFIKLLRTEAWNQ